MIKQKYTYRIIEAVTMLELKNQFGIIVLADNYSISLRDMGFEGGGKGDG